jgi:glycosyltransferase involved in cell wall biosynthesis
VSVLILTYNQQKYISDAIESALMQKTTFDYEILIGEDCSTDSTRKIVCEYAARNPSKIRPLLHSFNVGGLANIQQLLAESCGEFVNLLEGDDYWTCPGKLQKQVEFLDQHPECSLCFHNALRMYEDEDRVPLPYNSADQKPISTLADLWQYDFIATCTAMFRKSSARSLPGWYFTLPLGGDWALWMLCSEHGDIGYIDEMMAVYRIHKEGRWNKLDKIGKLEEIIACYERLNSNFAFRYDAIVQPLILKKKTELRLAQKINQLLTACLPPTATVLIMSRPDEELPRFHTHEVWPFPTRTPRDTRQILASGASGSVEAPWIGNKGTYRFELFQTAEESRLLASIAVSQNNDSPSETYTNKEVIDGHPYIVATPNPVPKQSGFGKTVISWSTGDGSPGHVEVALEGQPVHYPPNDEAAIAELEGLRSKGAEFLLAPSSARALFQRYPELQKYVERNYRVITSEKDVGSVYDLR